MHYCSKNHEQSTSILLKYYLSDTNANDNERYHLIELKDQFQLLRNALNTIKNYQANQQTGHTTSTHSPSKHSSIKINIELLQFCLDLNQLLKLMECPNCNKSQLNLRSALYLQLKHAIFINQLENDRILASVRRFEGMLF